MTHAPAPMNGAQKAVAGAGLSIAAAVGLSMLASLAASLSHLITAYGAIETTAPDLPPWASKGAAISAAIAIEIALLAIPAAKAYRDYIARSLRKKRPAGGVSASINRLRAEWSALDTMTAAYAGVSFAANLYASQLAMGGWQSIGLGGRAALVVLSGSLPALILISGHVIAGLIADVQGYIAHANPGGSWAAVQAPAKPRRRPARRLSAAPTASGRTDSRETGPRSELASPDEDVARLVAAAKKPGGVDLETAKEVANAGRTRVYSMAKSAGLIAKKGRFYDPQTNPPV